MKKSTISKWALVTLTCLFVVIFIVLAIGLVQGSHKNIDRISASNSNPETIKLSSETGPQENNIKEANNTIAANLNLALDPRTNPMRIDVDSEDGVITLDGIVNSERKKQIVENVVDEVVAGEVVNQLKVGKPTLKPPAVVSTWIVRSILLMLLILLVFVGINVWLAQIKKRNDLVITKGDFVA